MKSLLDKDHLVEKLEFALALSQSIGDTVRANKITLLRMIFSNLLF